ncbi:MAG: LOG family protein [Acidimicrobiales bacterium]
MAVGAVCVFCSSSTPPDPRYRDAALSVAEEVARRDLTLVYGGGRVGLMGIVADAALALGARVVGVIPVGLFSREVGHTGLSELHQVGSMHERKELMYDLADGFVALPGGLGTLEELAEVATWTQLGLHAKAVTLLDVAGFWRPLVAQLDAMVDQGFLKPANRAIVRTASRAAEALDLLESPPEAVEKWIDDPER